MRGYVNKTIMVDAELMERFNYECRRRTDYNGYLEPTLSRFVNDALSDYMDTWFSDYPDPDDDE